LLFSTRRRKYVEIAIFKKNGRRLRLRGYLKIPVFLDAFEARWFMYKAELSVGWPSFSETVFKGYCELRFKFKFKFKRCQCVDECLFLVAFESKLNKTKQKRT
jgi:hypothetical protein